MIGNGDPFVAGKGSQCHRDNAVVRPAIRKAEPHVGSALRAKFKAPACRSFVAFGKKKSATDQRVLSSGGK